MSGSCCLAFPPGPGTVQYEYAHVFGPPPTVGRPLTGQYDADEGQDPANLLDKSLPNIPIYQLGQT